MCYQTPGYSCGYMPMNNCCGYQQNRRSGTSYALILVLFILLVIIGAARW